MTFTYPSHLLVVKSVRKTNAQDTYIIAQDIDGAPIPTDLPPSYFGKQAPINIKGYGY